LIFYAFDPVAGQGQELYRSQLGLKAIHDSDRDSDLDWSVSPDGSLVAFEDGELVPEQIRVLDFRTRAEKTLQLPQGWNIGSLRWAADGHALFATVQSTENLLVRITLDGKPDVLLNRGKNRVFFSVRPSPDDRYLAFGQDESESNAWLLENFSGFRRS
jgi:dipeptidyl aminopeptidase/acylaminoacyl peptidase